MAFRSDLEAVILGVLQAGPAHGYEIARRIEAYDVEQLKAGEGRLYPALHKLEKEGYLASGWEEQQGRPARKTYMLTSRGSVRLREERKRWTEFRDAVNPILGVESHG